VENELKEIRRSRLKLLLKRFGKDKELAEALGVEANYVSNIKNGHKTLGDDARKWEAKLGLSRGWFDMPGDDQADEASLIHIGGLGMGITQAALALAVKWDALSPLDRAAIEREINKRANRKKPSESGSSTPGRRSGSG
jgi:transcriptional regulator with XRE-family HTH domain